MAWSCASVVKFVVEAIILYIEFNCL